MIIRFIKKKNMRGYKNINCQEVLNCRITYEKIISVGGQYVYLYSILPFMLKMRFPFLSFIFKNC
jgi:hypothetical protein